MFKDDIALVTEQVEKYKVHALTPMADLGGLAKPTIADYSITMRTGNQMARYVALPNGARPFDHLDRNYKIFNPEQGDPPIEELPTEWSGALGTIVCLNVIEHVVNPFAIFKAFRKLLRKGGLAIVSTVFSFPYHPSPRDYWRFSPDCLRMLTQYADLVVLEADWRLTILANQGIQEIHTGEPQEVRSVYVTLTKP